MELSYSIDVLLRE